MSQRRMFSLKIVDTDAFLDMPQSSQLLYFHLSMRADDEGFVGNPKKIMKISGSNDDDMKVLLTKRFILNFKSGVVVIKHWLIHNTIRMDRFNPTTYKEERELLSLKDNRSYTEWQPNGNQLATQVKLSKVNLIKDNTSFKNKKPFFNGMEMRKKQGKWYCLPKDSGEWLEFAGDFKKDVVWK